MKTKPFIKSLAIFLFVLFTGTKVFGFHELLHDHDDHEDNIEECLVCDKALIDQFSPFDGEAQFIEIPEAPQEFHKGIIEKYVSQIHTTELSSVLFSRPPPFLN